MFVCQRVSHPTTHSEKIEEGGGGRNKLFKSNIEYKAQLFIEEKNSEKWEK